MRVAVALSGGVDSAVTAARVVEAGHEAVGVHLLLGAGSVPETRDARGVADAVGIPLVVWDLRDRFEHRVLDYFTSSYAAGRTPNPCLRCNREVKFRGLLSRGIEEGFDAVATGHYARLQPARDGSIGLHRAANVRKDQSYVLGVLSQDDLRHCLFPLGTVTTKDEVREEAERRGLPVAHKPDSTDICFVTEGGAAEFLAGRLADRQGDIVDARGTVLGTHHGIQHFTVGQRKGSACADPQTMASPAMSPPWTPRPTRCTSARVASCWWVRWMSKTCPTPARHSARTGGDSCSSGHMDGRCRRASRRRTGNCACTSPSPSPGLHPDSSSSSMTLIGCAALPRSLPVMPPAHPWSLSTNRATGDGTSPSHARIKP